jgi:CBS domain-containing protein
MTPDVQTIAPGATVEEALEQMARSDIGRLPVLRERRLVGIVSRADVLRRLYAHAKP